MVNHRQNNDILYKFELIDSLLTNKSCQKFLLENLSEVFQIKGQIYGLWCLSFWSNYFLLKNLFCSVMILSFDLLELVIEYEKVYMQASFVVNSC